MSKKSLTQKYLINGPNNAVRLTNGDKVIYIFSDFHYGVDAQLECPFDKKYESIDIDKLLIKFFNKEIKKGSDTVYDMFIETEGNSHFVNSYNTIAKTKYIEQIRKLFNINNYVNDKNQVIKTNTYPNVRFHYFDFRFETFSLEYNYFFNLYIDIQFPYSGKQLSYLMPKIKELREKLYNSLAYLNIHDTNKDDKTNKKSDIKSKHINKILNKISDPKIKKKINEIYKILVIKYIGDNIKLCTNIIDYIAKYDNKLFSKDLTLEEEIKLQTPILLNIELIRENLLYPYTILTDLYLIRRILDKKYTKNNIIYTGAAHFTDIIILLVKYFDFEITNIYHNELDKHMHKLDKIYDFINNIDINNTFDYPKLRKYITNGPDSAEFQCINLYHFPDNFT